MLFVARRQSDDVLREAGHFVHLLFDRQAGAQVVKFHGAGGFGEDREGEGIPFGKNLAVGDVFAVLDAEARAVNDVVALLLAFFSSTMAISPARFHGEEVPPRPSTNFMSTNLTTPLLRASSVERSETRVAVPPMWKVRMVSCVPGSPMD